MTIFDTYDLLEDILQSILVVDVKTNKIIFMNKMCKNTLGVTNYVENTSVSDMITIFDGDNNHEITMSNVIDKLNVNQKLEFQNVTLKPFNNVKLKCSIQIGCTDKTMTKIYFIFQKIKKIENVEFLYSYIKYFPESLIILTLDEELTLCYGNEVFHKNFNSKEICFPDISNQKLMNSEDDKKRKLYIEDINSQLLKNKNFSIEIELEDSFHDFHTVCISGVQVQSLIHTEDKKLCCKITIIDDKMELIKSLESERDFFNVAYSLSSDLLFKLDLKTRIIRYIGPMRLEIGLPEVLENYPESIIEREFIFHPDEKIFLSMAEKMFQGLVCPARFRVRIQTGDLVWSKCEYAITRDSNGVPVEAIGVLSNNHSEKVLEEKIIIDQLTGCLTKFAFEKAVQEVLEAEHENNNHSIFIVDVDNFKDINDNLGHKFGDSVLKEIGEKLCLLFRNSDFVGRIGGDEFMVFLRNSADHDILKSKAEKVLELLDNTYQGNQHSVRITGSVGISLYPHDGIVFNDLYINADTALYATKSKGKKGYTFYNNSLLKGAMENTTPFDIMSRTISK